MVVLGPGHGGCVRASWVLALLAATELIPGPHPSPSCAAVVGWAPWC